MSKQRKKAKELRHKAKLERRLAKFDSPGNKNTMEELVARARTISYAHRLPKERFDKLTPEDLTLHGVINSLFCYRAAQDFIRAGIIEDREDLMPYHNQWLDVTGVIGGFRWFTKIDGRKTFRVLLLNPRVNGGFGMQPPSEVGLTSTPLPDDAMANVQHVWLELFQSTFTGNLKNFDHIRLQEGMVLRCGSKVNQYAPGRYGLDQTEIFQVGVPRYEGDKIVEIRSVTETMDFNVHGAEWRQPSTGWNINLNRSDISKVVGDALQEQDEWYSQTPEILNAMGALMLLMSYDTETQGIAIQGLDKVNDGELIKQIKERQVKIKDEGLSALAPAVRRENLDISAMPNVHGIPFMTPRVVDLEAARQPDVWAPIDHSRGIDFRGDYWTRINYQIKKKVLSRIEKRPGNDLSEHAKLGVHRAAQLIKETIGDDGDVHDLLKVLEDREYAATLVKQLDMEREFHREIKGYFFDKETAHGYHDRHTDRFGNLYPQTTRFNRVRIGREAVQALANEVKMRYHRY